MSKNDQIGEKIVQQVVCDKVIKSDIYRDRFVYNSRVKPKEIETLFAQKAGKKHPNTTQASTIYGQVIWASVKAAHNNVKTVQEHVRNGDSVDKSSPHVNCRVGELNPSPHTSIAAKVMSGVETPNKRTSSPNCVGSDECVARIRQFSRSHIRDLNPNLSTNIVEVECNTKVPNVNTSSELVVNDESLVTNVDAGLNESGSSPGPLTNPAAEVMSRPRGRDPLPSGYTGQCGSTSNIRNHITAKVTTLGERGQHVDITCVGSDNGSSVNTGYQKVSQRCENTNRLIFDINQALKTNSSILFCMLGMLLM